MLLPRIIPCLLLNDGSIVKSTRFNKFNYVGDPTNIIRIFNRLQVDELIILDILSSKVRSDISYDLIKNIAGECFMPFTYGGGINSVDKASKIFDCGVEKICINSTGLENHNLITELATKYGSQSIVVSIDVKKNIFGKKCLYNHVSKKFLKYSPLEWAKLAEELGAGEILLTNVDNEGMWNGLDLDLIKSFSSNLEIPVIAHGGASSLKNIFDGINECKASAVAVGSLFVYQKKHMGVLVNYPSEMEINKFILG